MADTRPVDVQPASQFKTIKVTAVGEGYGAKDTGRTGLLHLESNVVKKELTVDGRAFSVSLRDTGDMEELDRLQPAVYRDTDCFLLCYSESERPSFDAVESKWCQEISRICPNVPFVLVAYKSAVFGGADARNVTAAEGQKLQQKIGAVHFVEYTGDDALDTLLGQAVRATLAQKPVKTQVQSGAAYHDEHGSSPGCCACFRTCFKSKESSYSFQ